jgi:threonine/homoserine/homoserine lactone efflux protein
MPSALAIQDFGIFVLLGLLINVAPGPDLQRVTTRAAEHGLAAGLVTALGLVLGCVLPLVIAALGLSALLAASDYAALAARAMGGAWLGWVGVHLWLSPTPDPAENLWPQAPAWARSPFLQALAVHAANPRVGFFFAALLAQFADPAAPGFAAGFAVLALFFFLDALAVMALFAWRAARRRAALQPGALGASLNRLLGGALMALTVRMLVQEFR